MSQILYRNDGKGIREVRIDRMFKDNGKDPIYGMIGGHKVMISEGVRPKPEVFQIGEEFFYGDGQPVRKEEDVDHLPAVYKEMAIKYIHKLNGGEVKERPMFKASPKKGRGRPRKEQKEVIEIKDEESLASITK